MITEFFSIHVGGCADTHPGYLRRRKVGDVADFPKVRVQAVTIFSVEVNMEGECSCTKKLEPNFYVI
jgi:hypothetical protein